MRLRITMLTWARSSPTPRSRRLKFKLDQAERQAGKIETEENKAEVKRCKKEYNQKLLEVWKHRAERYPNQLPFRLELGQQYMTLGDYGEAIKEFQVARNDPRRKGFCLLLLGECFKRIKQKRLAMEHYEAAIQEIPDRDADNKKKALLRRGQAGPGHGRGEKSREIPECPGQHGFFLPRRGGPTGQNHRNGR